jgi:flavoprotein
MRALGTEEVNKWFKAFDNLENPDDYDEIFRQLQELKLSPIAASESQTSRFCRKS